jgi:hypothetical protein
MSLKVIIKQGVLSQERAEKNEVGAGNTLHLTQNVTG